ncbi:dTDP-4-dehydrorhamnose reductase [bacterium]|nr:dTDP-4-dehydrorhamnose reductase [bacterium]
MATNRKILILGSAGQLAKAFISSLEQRGMDFVAPAESESSITDFDQISRLLDKTKPGIIINCAAYNAVDAAEEDPETALLVNARAVENLAQQCEKRSLFLVHYGSDYVFDGNKGDLYTEEDDPNPLNVYGRSKLEGEVAVREIMSRYLVFRLSWVIGPGTQNFLHKLSGWAEQNRILKISADEVSVPTFTDDVVKVTLLALEKGLQGLYHLTNSSYASRYELARYYIEKTGRQNIVVPVPMSSFKTAARRPLFAAMSNRKIQKELGIDIPTWQEGVDRFCERSS